MAMKSLASPSFVMFDAVCVDGTRSCESTGQRVGRFGWDEPARGMIEAQDREVAAASGRTRSDVGTIVRSPLKVLPTLRHRKVRGGGAIGAVARGHSQLDGRGWKRTPGDGSISVQTKIDDLVTIGHNVEIGMDCLLCAQVGLAGVDRR